MTTDDAAHDLNKTVDSDELEYFLVSMPSEHTEAEKTLKQGLASLRKMKRALAELVQIRKEERSRVVIKAGEKAKEEAMELLRSGAIQIEDKKERHTFKRKPKEIDEDDVTMRVKPVPKEKTALYTNFRRGPKLLPQRGDTKLSECRDSTLAQAAPPERVKGMTSDSAPEPARSASVSDAETAASKRKQQLIALSDDEEDYGNDFSMCPDSASGLISSRDQQQRDGSSSHSRSSEVTLYVAYHKLTMEFIHDTFEPIGQIVRVRMGEQQNHAYVTMATREMAQKALELDHHMVNNRLLRVTYARRSATSRFRQDDRTFRPFSPGMRRGRSLSYNAVPPHDRHTRQNDGSGFAYEDLDNMNE